MRYQVELSHVKWKKCMQMQMAMRRMMGDVPKADVVITKESGAEGGYLDKVRPALDAGLDCIVLTRPVSPVQGEELLDGPAAFARRLAAWQMAAPVRG